MQQLLESFLRQSLHIFNSNILKVGDTYISLSSIFQLIFSSLVVLFLIRIVKRFLRNRLLLKLGIDEGNREALSTIISYSLGTIGLITVLQTTGFNLASLAVIAGGLGVGIGFGLQDLTKDFVSGLTLLFERSLKVGDFVEFDGLSGYIKAISLRSTIIRTREGGDVLVPNSTLVESKIINWSYESYIGRIDIPVGVAYDSDPVIVTEILLNSAYMEPRILAEPATKVIFQNFGDNSLNFELRVWVDRIDQEPEIRSSLNFIIEYNLRASGITVPFPQRDLWLRNPEVLTSLQTQQKESREVTLAPSPVGKSQNSPLPLKELLRQVKYFQNFTDLELRKLIEVGYRKRLSAQHLLFQEGDAGDAFYIVLSGSVEVFVEKIAKHLTTLCAGDFLGELALMLGVPRTASVRAKEETILFVINHKSFKKLLHQHPDLLEVVVKELEKHQEELSQRQVQLKELGTPGEDENNPVSWVRKRFKSLFGL
ncbi:MAG: mechanosensitive ion channel domain-containing protein [Spirulinaceae cyanobacterium]